MGNSIDSVFQNAKLILFLEFYITHIKFHDKKNEGDIRKDTALILRLNNVHYLFTWNLFQPSLR